MRSHVAFVGSYLTFMFAQFSFSAMVFATPILCMLYGPVGLVTLVPLTISAVGGWHVLMKDQEVL